MRRFVTSIKSLFFASSSISGITFWTTEVQPARMAKQQEMAKDFESKTGISAEVIPVEEKDLGKSYFKSRRYYSFSGN